MKHINLCMKDLADWLSSATKEHGGRDFTVPRQAHPPLRSESLLLVGHERDRPQPQLGPDLHD